MRHRRRRMALAALLCLWSGAAQAASSARIETFLLKNGMEVVVIPNHRVPAVSHMVWYRVGAADDPQGKSGLAHYHEHMMYQGAGRLKAGEYAETVARNGGRENAFTGHDAVSYYVDIDKARLPLAMELEAERMRGLNPDKDAAQKEKQVILEERRTRVESNPGALLNEQVNAALYRHHPYHIPVIGWMHEMEGLTEADVVEFHQRWYHPGNALLIISGDVTAAEVRPLAEKYYGVLPKKTVPGRAWREEPPQNSERRVTLKHKNVKKPAWSRTYAVASEAYGAKEHAMPLFLLSNILGGGKSSRLYQALVVEQKLATGVDVDYNGFSLGPAQFEISLTPEEGVDLETLERALDAELEKLMKDGAGEAELARARRLLKAESVFARDGLSSMARIMGWLRIAGLPAEYFNEWDRRIDAVTAGQATAAARASLLKTHSVTGILLPEEAP